MGNHFDRGLLHFQQHRWQEALSEFQSELGEDPECGRTRAFMALCLLERGQAEPALELAREAVGRSPDEAFPHYVLAGVLHQQEDLAQARAAIEEALRLDPEHAPYWGRRAAIQIDQRESQAGLASAEEGLRLDPTDTTCQNLRSIALVRLGRKAEARQGIEEALQRDPEDSLSHANRGWTLLHQGEPRLALESFHESLRLDPTSEWAREGMLVALRARFPLYRGVFRFQFWLANLSPRARWAVILGGFFGAKFLARAAKANPSLAPWVLPLICLYGAFVILTWIGEPLTNAFLLFHRTARLSLGTGARFIASLFVVLVAASLLSLAAAAWTWDERFAFLSFGCLCLVLPISTIPEEPPAWRRGILIASSACIALAFLALGLASFTGPDRSALALTGATIVFVGGMLSTWIATGLQALVERSRSRRAR